jgi:RNA recognition motif-containing protein
MKCTGCVRKPKMREKLVRDAPHATEAAFRLTEYEPERKNDFVNRLNKETTSFFFTNLPEETPVMELWKVFARYGRVGEVYLPMKLDKLGRKFGFVKYKEVKEVEELSRKLDDV